MQIKDLPLTDRDDLSVANPDDAIAKAAAILSHMNIGALPVCEETGALIGIISERDIVHGFSESGIKLSEQKVSDLMTADVITCRLNDDVKEIMMVMNKHGFRHLPVMDGDRLISIVSSRDVMAATLEETKSQFKTMGLAYEMVR